MKPCTTLTTADLLDRLGNVTIFSGFSHDDLLNVCSNCALVEARIGEIILEEGTPATEILILLKGRVAIVLNMEDEPIELMQCDPGSCIGEASVIGIQMHSASAVVVEDATLMVLRRQVLMQLFDENKALFSLLILNIARELARRLHHTDEVLLHYGKEGKHHSISHDGAIKRLKDLPNASV
ncbi:MAG: cyclic nucleotide-binding domain-containing protein [Chitinispirillaceae bacterium]|nr:cyclic nucleotide-binding domain-containing protein [Chitinispirillaceae bacterium]